MVMLSTAQPLPDPYALEFEGVATRGDAGDGSPLATPLTDTSRAMRGRPDRADRLGNRLVDAAQCPQAGSEVSGTVPRTFAPRAFVRRTMFSVEVRVRETLTVSRRAVAIGRSAGLTAAGASCRARACRGTLLTAAARPGRFRSSIAEYEQKLTAARAARASSMKPPSSICWPVCTGRRASGRSNELLRSGVADRTRRRQPFSQKR